MSRALTLAMTRTIALLAFLPLLTVTTPASARGSQVIWDQAELPAYLQCVPYARETSGVQIYGDAHTWWDQADGRYSRGNRPKKGAVMAFAANGSMQLGHVATVSRVIDKRTVLLDHANWSPINGRRGQVERDVRAIDVSSGNDWSEVRVWYAPIGGIGTTVWPVHGFIYGKGYAPRTTRRPHRMAHNAHRAVRASVSPKFASAFSAPRGSKTRAKHRSAPNPAPVVRTARSSAPDPLDAVVSRYE